MSNVVKMPEQEKCVAEASNWIVVFDRGISDVEKRDFQAWLSADQRHYQQFMVMAKLWDGMDELSRLSSLFADEDGARSTSFRATFAVAASAVFCVCLLSFWLGKPLLVPPLATAYETSVGEHSTVNLPDGSRVVLNTNSLVTVDYDDRHRLVTLIRGEIHIDVAHDESRPLSVKAGDKVVQAVGTAFNIELHRNNRLELIVTDGEVRVGDRAVFESIFTEQVGKTVTQLPENQRLRRTIRLPVESLSIAMGEKVILGVQKVTPVKIKSRDIEASLSWRQGNLVFDGQTLEAAIEEISRYTPVEFDFEGEEIRDVRIAGLFKAGDVNGLLSALSETFNISSKKTAKERIKLYRAIKPML